MLLGSAFGVHESDVTSMICDFDPKMAKLQPAYRVCLFAFTVSHLRPMVLGIQQFALNGEPRNGVQYVLYYTR